MLIGLFQLAVAFIKAIDDFFGKNGPQLAAAISYYALFSLLPLALAIIFGLSFLLGPESIEELAKRAAEQAPVSKGTISDVLSGTLHNRELAGTTGIIGLLWTGTAVFGAIRKGINATWGITKPRPFLQERLIDISLMLAAAILMLISISSTAMLSYLREILAFITTETHVNSDILWDRLASLVPPSLSFVVFLGIYRFLPNAKVDLKEVLPGAIAATIAFEVVTNLFVWYVHNYSVYTTVYGSLGSIVALLAWVYVSANILLFGSLITSRYSIHRTIEAKTADYIEEIEVSSLQIANRD